MGGVRGKKGKYGWKEKESWATAEGNDGTARFCERSHLPPLGRLPVTSNRRSGGSQWYQNRSVWPSFAGVDPTTRWILINVYWVAQQLKHCKSANFFPNICLISSWRAQATVCFFFNVSCLLLCAMKMNIFFHVCTSPLTFSFFFFSEYLML